MCIVSNSWLGRWERRSTHLLWRCIHTKQISDLSGMTTPFTAGSREQCPPSVRHKRTGERNVGLTVSRSPGTSLDHPFGSPSHTSWWNSQPRTNTPTDSHPCRRPLKILGHALGSFVEIILEFRTASVMPYLMCIKGSWERAEEVRCGCYTVPAIVPPAVSQHSQRRYTRGWYMVRNVHLLRAWVNRFI